MEYTVRKVENGFVVRVEGEDPVEGYVSKEMVFSRNSQVLKYLRDTLQADEKNA